MMSLLIALAAQASVAPPAPSTDKVASADGEKLVCKRTVETGSFLRARKVCLTRRQWQRVSDESQELGRSMRPALTQGTQ